MHIALYYITPLCTCEIIPTCKEEDANATHCNWKIALNVHFLIKAVKKKTLHCCTARVSWLEK
jgi:hypothetical protein